MTLDLVAGPASEPVTLDEAKLYARIDQSDEDDAVSMMIAAARGMFERETGLILVRQSWTLSLDLWPKRGADGLRRCYLPLRPILSLTSITVDGAVVPETDYSLDASAAPPRLIEARGGAWPKPSAKTGGIVIAFDAGFGDAEDDVPAPIRLAILRLVAEAYDTRGVAGAPGGLTQAVADILAPYREARL
jgi:uncharacterized phiE125 gp8 family phage protein